jgi:phosphopantetheine adenylyltransferase
MTEVGGVGSTEPQRRRLDGAGAERPSSILVVANETLTGGNLIETLWRRAKAGPVRVHVVAPVSPPRRGYVVYRDSRRAAAERRLQKSLRVLHAAGISAEGEVVDDEPLAAVRDALAMTHVDEIVVSTHPESRSGWLRRHLVEEIDRIAGTRPVEHVISDVTGDEGVNVLVVANETVLGEELLDRIRTRAKEGPASFLIVCPQSDPRGRPHPEAESRLWTAVFALRSEGIDVHGQVAHPDPYAAAMQAVHDERTDEIIVSTYPGTRSGWLRRDLVGRLRADAGVPVEHVIVESIEERAPAA